MSISQTPQGLEFVKLENDVYFPLGIMKAMRAHFKKHVDDMTAENMIPFARKYMAHEMSSLEIANYHRDHANPYSANKVFVLMSE